MTEKCRDESASLESADFSDDSAWGDSVAERERCAENERLRSECSLVRAAISEALASGQRFLRRVGPSPSAVPLKRSSEREVWEIDGDKNAKIKEMAGILLERHYLGKRVHQLTLKRRLAHHAHCPAAPEFVRKRAESLLSEFYPTTSLNSNVRPNKRCFYCTAFKGF